MALELRTTAAFERDLRRVNKQGKGLDKLETIVNTWDCHVEPDWLLLYRMTGEALTLLRSYVHG
jgi:mRNA-degrading endonuclease YafQ of YafQ-DinJ toxin-antitoxin module